MSEEPASIRSRWTLSDYKEMLCLFRDSGIDVVQSSQFADGRAGLWLRHDVELCLEAAVAMAAVEFQMRIPSTYFVCVESPFFADGAPAIGAFIERLVELEREVSFHLVLTATAQPVEVRLLELLNAFPAVPKPAMLTFHAPGVSSSALAQVPLGSGAYSPMARRTCKYFSDSRGDWRWGDPRTSAIAATDSVQLLTHPFWWGGTEGAAELAIGTRSEFLPQLTGRAALD